MPDADVRSLERTWRSSGSEEDYRAWLRGRQREGTLSQEALQVAAYVGDEVARELMSADDARLVLAPKSGVQRFMAELPGGERAEARAAVAACRFALSLPGQSKRPLPRRAVETLEAWLEGRDHDAPALLMDLEAWLVQQISYFNPELPPIAIAYEADEDYGLEAACWIVTKHALGHVKRNYEEVGRCMAGLLPKKAGQTKLRAAIKGALVPWVFTQLEPVSGTPKAPGLDVFKTRDLTLEQAEAVLADVPAKGELKVADAKTAIRAFLLARGYVPRRTSFHDDAAGLKIQLKSKVVLVLQGKPGDWCKVAGSQGRPIYLKQIGNHLRDAALARRDRG